MKIRSTAAQSGAKSGGGKGDEALHLGLWQAVLAVENMDRKHFWLVVLKNQPQRPIRQSCLGLIGQNAGNAEPSSSRVDGSFRRIDDQPRLNRNPQRLAPCEGPAPRIGERTERDAVVLGEVLYIAARLFLLAGVFDVGIAVRLLPQVVGSYTGFWVACKLLLAAAIGLCCGMSASQRKSVSLPA